MKLRNYTTKDFNQVINLLKKANLYLKKIDKKRIFEKKIKYDPESIIVAEQKDKIIGVVFFVYDPWWSYIYHLVIDIKYRNKGIGNKLMNEAEKRLKNRGIKFPVLFVIEKNKDVIEFYKKRGWFIISKQFCLGKNL